MDPAPAPARTMFAQHLLQRRYTGDRSLQLGSLAAAHLPPPTDLQRHSQSNLTFGEVVTRLDVTDQPFQILAVERHQLIGVKPNVPRKLFCDFRIINQSPEQLLP